MHVPGPRVLIDAAIVYGAERILTGRHDDEKWKFRVDYKREDDERLFREFLHQLVLCDALYLDASSLGEEISTEIFSLGERINDGRKLDDRQGILRVFRADMEMNATPESVQSHFCEYFARRLDRDEPLAGRIRTVPVPWAYKQEGHHDRSSIRYHLTQYGPSDAFVDTFLAFVLFAWRGLMYGAIAQSERQNGNDLSAYVAAPGRMSALREILDAADVGHFQFPREAWLALLKELPTLPKRGSSFSFLRSLPAVDTSPLAPLLTSLKPIDALDYVLRWRNSVDAMQLRAEWHELLDAGRDTSIVGSTNIQIAKNLTIHGDFNQMIVARPSHY